MSFGTSENSFLSSFWAALQPLEKNVVVNNLGVKQTKLPKWRAQYQPTGKARKFNPKGDFKSSRLQSPKRKRETELQTQWKTVQKVACLRFGNSNTEEMRFQIFDFDLIVWNPNSKLREALNH